MKKDARNFNARMGGWLKQLRLNAALTQTELAAAVGVNRNTIGSYEKGVAMTLWIYLEIARALDVPADLPPRW